MKALFIEGTRSGYSPDQCGKTMTKQQYMNAHGLTLRKVSPQDRAEARTDYQREAEYIISNGRIEWYSKRGTLKDLKAFVEARVQELSTIKAEAAEKLNRLGYDGKSMSDDYIKITAYFHGKPSRVLTKSGVEIYL